MASTYSNYIRQSSGPSKTTIGLAVAGGLAVEGGIGYAAWKKCKKYVVQYRNRDNTEKLKHDEVTRIINTDHVLLCDNSKTKHNFNSNMRQLEKTLSETKTLPSLHSAILKILEQHWRHGRTIKPREFNNEYGLKDTIKNESTIGWNNFILGRWSQR